jgi:hypothetical protein
MDEVREQEWFIFTENRAAVVDALERGECDGILPAARGFVDGFAEFCLESGVLSALDTFPDPRERRSIPMFFFCNTLIYRPLFQLQRLAPIERTLFRSPYILRQLGFNARQVEEGFYDTRAGAKPFTIKALTEVFARTQPEDFLSNQQEVLQALWAYCPGAFRSALWVMDSVHIHVPAGAHTPAATFKACVLGVWQDDVVWPLLWAFVPEEQAEITIGRQLFAIAEEVLGKGTIQHLLVDRGYLDGAWITALYQHGTRVTLGVKEAMLVLEEMFNLSRAPDSQWEKADPPKLHQEPLPEREVMSISSLQGEWSTCEAPLSGCLIRDTYPDEVKYRALVTTAPNVPAREILADDRCRWTLEEVYMTLTRYWQFDDLAPCRASLAYAQVHFTFLAFTLLGFYLQETDVASNLETLNNAPPPLPLPERELAVYAGSHFALFLPSELVDFILANIDAWQANRDQLILALRLCEGHS